MPLKIPKVGYAKKAGPDKIKRGENCWGRPAQINKKILKTGGVAPKGDFMFNLENGAKDTKLFSRRKLLKQALLTGAGLGASAFTAGTVLADNADPASSKSGVEGGSSSQLNLSPKQVASPSEPTPGTTYKMFAGLEFKPINSSIGYGAINFSGIYATTQGFFFLPIDLPQGAKITELEFYNYHNTIYMGQMTLQTLIPSSNLFDFVAGSNINTQANNIQTIKITIPANIKKIDQTSIKYFLVWHPGDINSNEILLGGRLGYTGGIARFGA